MNRRGPLARIGAVFLMIAALAFVVSACGGDDSTSDQTGTDNAEPVAQIDSLTGVETQVALDSGFVDALTKLNVAPGPVGDAKISKDGVATFPITGGNITYYDPASGVEPYVQGVIDHEGSGLSLTAGKVEVELTDFVVDPGAGELTGTVSVNGKEAATDAVLFDLDVSTLKPLETNPDGTATLDGAKVELSGDAASLLNDTFGINDLAGGLAVGTATITVEG